MYSHERKDPSARSLFEILWLSPSLKLEGRASFAGVGGGEESQQSSTAREQQSLVFSELLSSYFHSLLWSRCDGVRPTALCGCCESCCVSQAGTGHGHCWDTAGLRHSSCISKGHLLKALQEGFALPPQSLSGTGPRKRL